MKIISVDIDKDGYNAFLKCSYVNDLNKVRYANQNLGPLEYITVKEFSDCLISFANIIKKDAEEQEFKMPMEDDEYET